MIKKFFFFLGYNLRLESPILNIKIRKRCLKEDIYIYSIGSNFNDNLNSVLLGLNINVFIKYLQGKLKICNNLQKKLKKDLLSNFLTVSTFLDFNIFLIGNNIINRLDNHQIYKILKKLNNYINIINLSYYNSSKYLFNFFFDFCKKNLSLYLIQKNINIQNNLNIININLTSILYEELNLFNNIHNINLILKNDILYLLGIDSFKFSNFNFLVFQGHHVNSTYFNIDLILPSITFLEKSSHFINIEGNILQTNFILYPPVFCRNDWSILNALYHYIINFVTNVYKLDFKKSINFLNTNRFYLQINHVNKIISLLKILSINFYFVNITNYKKYLYTIDNLDLHYCNNITKIYNSILFHVYYNPYILNIVSQYSTTLQACGIINNIFLEEKILWTFGFKKLKEDKK